MNAYLQRLQDAITIVTADMSVADMMRRPASGKWSAAETLEHLCLTYRGTARNLEHSLETGKPLAGVLTVKQRLIKMVVLDLGYFPSGRESPKSALPNGMPAEQLPGEIKISIGAMDGLIRKCGTTFGDSTLITDHPVLGPFTAKQWGKFHWAHGRHHLKQISRMRSQIENA